MTESQRVGEGVGFERIRRITGYLTGSLDKWCDSKKAEESQRVKHSLSDMGGNKDGSVRV